MLGRVREEREDRRPRLRARAALLLVLAMLAGGTVGAPVALGAGIEGGNSFNELSSKAQEEENTTSTAATTGTATEAHNSNETIFIGLGAAAVLLLGIAYVIVRDARRVAPAGADDIGEGRPARDRAVQHRKRRQKAKAAKAQRKKHR